MSHCWKSLCCSTTLAGAWLCTLMVVGGCQSTTTTGRLTLPSTTSQSGVVVRGQDEDKGVVGFLDPKLLFKKAKVAAGYGPNRQVAEAAFAEGERLFVAATKTENPQTRRKQFQKAAAKYKIAVNRLPDSTLEEDAMFMWSEASFFADDYPEAAKIYERLVKKFPNTRHMDTIDKRRFAIARYWVEHQQKHPELAVKPNLNAKDRPLFDKFGNAMRVFNKIRLDDPTGKLSDDATMAAGIAHFKQGHWMNADEMFTDLRRSFPDSEHQFQAHLLGLQCKLKLYQGADYSALPLDEAETLIKQMYRQFPTEAREHHEYLAKAWREVRLDKAQHEYAMGNYYERRDEGAAAKLYYRRVREEYGDTSLAQDAAERIARLSDVPDEPDQALPWLARMFPTPDRQRPLVARNPLDVKRR